MTAVKIAARDIIVQVSDGQVTPTWTAIAGFTTAKLNPSENEENTDITTFDDDGQYSEVIMQRGATLEVEGFMIKDDATGAQDTGQARCEALAAAVGYASRGQVRFRHPVDSQWKVWTATVSVGEQGGENNDMTAWAATFVRCGAATLTAVA